MQHTAQKVTLVVAHVATLLTLAHRFTGTRAGRRITGHNVAAPHWSPNFILGAMLSEVTSNKRLERANAVVTPPSDVHTPCHSNLSSTGSLRCDQCTSRNSARCCASPMYDCTPNIAQCTPTRILPRRPSPSFILRGWNLLVCFLGCSACHCT